MKTDPRVRIEIGLRDQRLFSSLCRVGCLTAKQIHSHFFVNANYRNAVKRLEKLSEYGYISRVSRRDGLATSIYYPNILSVKEYVSDADFEKGMLIKTLSPWYFPNFKHDDLVREFALKITELYPTSELYLDYQIIGGLAPNIEIIESSKRKVPDLFLKLDSGVSICIEIELTTKSLNRYKSILERYLPLRNFSVVYFFEEPRTPLSLQKAMAQMGLNSFPIVFVELTKCDKNTDILGAFNNSTMKALEWEKAMWGHATSPHQTKQKLSELLK